MIGALKICEPGGTGGMIFPLGGESEARDWPKPLRGALYALGMVYFFLGVAIVSDLFMASIEQVTARRRKKNTDGGMRTVKVWNETVATLSLMALGSSAPEILLSVIDIWKKKFHYGLLGPSTIVGSAAFNLLVIVAVCIMVIPSEETRVIKTTPVFYITALFSMIAYLWMAFIVSVSTPKVVEVHEAVITFLMLPIMIFMSYKTDIGDMDCLLRRLHIIDPEEETDEEAPAGHLGVLGLSAQAVSCQGSQEDQTVTIAIGRRQYKDSRYLHGLRCSFHTEATSAIPGYDFEAIEGMVEFTAGETEHRLELQIHGAPSRPRSTEFLLVFSDIEVEGDDEVTFDPQEDGGDEEAICTITIDCHGSPGLFESHVCRVPYLQMARNELLEQIGSALYCNGTAEDQKEASNLEFCLHLLIFPWKVSFSIVPPCCIWGGWCCFYASLGGIAVLTTGVSDLAELFGCVLDVPDIVTAITFVAMGTSMPDLFASLTSAKQDPTADAAIVNVTGSNSVNVFLGLGMPWTVATVYWKVNGRTDEWTSAYVDVAQKIEGAAFVVESKDLGYSVMCFCIVCSMALIILHIRRKLVKAELGGPWKAKLAASSALVFFWLAWVSVVSWKVLRGSDSGVPLAIFIICTTGALLLFLRVLRQVQAEEEEKEARMAEEANRQQEEMLQDGSTGGTIDEAQVIKGGTMGEAPSFAQRAPETSKKEVIQIYNEELDPVPQERVVGAVAKTPKQRVVASSVQAL